MSSVLAVAVNNDQVQQYFYLEWFGRIMLLLLAHLLLAQYEVTLRYPRQVRAVRMSISSYNMHFQVVVTLSPSFTTKLNCRHTVVTYS